MEIDEHAHERVGMVLNQKYTLHRLIGCGGMASVYEASHRNGHLVAIKLLHPELAERDDVRERFLREGYVANKVEHPGAVRVLDDDVDEDGSVFLVMELLEGATLDERCKQAGGLLPVREVCVLAYRVLEVLAAAHEKSVVHRDIKPENLFLTEAGALKVLDFGIARLLESTERHSATRTGTMIGTPAFMAPEQALGQWSQVDGQSDLWAVGATMFALISGQLVHDAETVQEMMVRAGSTQARSLRSVANHVPPRIAHVVDAALAFHKTDRWPDAWTMASRLQDAYLPSFGVPILAQGAPFHPASMHPRSIAATSGPARAVERIAPRSAPPLSTTIGLSREKARPPRRAGIRALALFLFALGSMIAGMVVASRKEPPAAVVLPASPPPPALLPAPLRSAATAEEFPPPQSSAALVSTDAQVASLDGASVVDASRSSANPAATSLRRAPVPLQPVFVPMMRPIEAPPATVSVTAPVTPLATAPATPSSTDSPTPSATASANPAYDPTFGL
jgi:serine/threonine protein kinase